jgi:hypothetical protein
VVTTKYSAKFQSPRAITRPLDCPIRRGDLWLDWPLKKVDLWLDWPLKNEDLLLDWPDNCPGHINT